jgi:ABC-type Fe3+/spermidine/putrescine transport system ATPase subunit
VNLEIRANQFVTFVGASGCGKSTLLRSIGRLERHSGDEILVDGPWWTAPASTAPWSSSITACAPGCG